MEFLLHGLAEHSLISRNRLTAGAQFKDLLSSMFTMPSFGGYVVRALRWLVPVLAAMVLVFIADPMWCHLLGWALAAAIATRGLLSLRLPLTPAADDSTASAGAERPGRR